MLAISVDTVSRVFSLNLTTSTFDYDKDAKTTRAFFKTVQNKMHYATHRHTAAELIVKRADAQKEHMGLNSWEI